MDKMEVDDDLMNICSSFNNIKVVDSLNLRIVSDLNFIIKEIINIGKLDVDIYEVCVSCGHDLTWNYDYYISQEDLTWLNSKGRIYFLNSLNDSIPIETTLDYFNINKIYDQLIELFKLQLE